MEKGILISFTIYAVEDVLAILEIYLFMTKILLMMPTNKKYRYVIAVVILICGDFIYALAIEHGWIRILFLMATVIYIGLGLVEGKRAECVVKTVFTFVGIELWDEIIAQVLISIFEQLDYIKGYHVEEIGKSIFGILCIMIAMIISRDNADYKLWIKTLKKRYYIWGIVFILNHVCLYYLLDLCCDTKYASIKLVTNYLQTTFVVLMLILCITFAIIDCRQKKYKNSSEKKDEYLRISKEHYNELKIQISEMRSIKHDMNSQYMALESLLETQQWEKAKDYLTTIREYQVECRKKVISTGNEIVDAVLNGIINRYTDINVNVIGNMRDICIKDFDLCTVMSNLFSNAVEATSKLRNKSKDITIEIKHHENILLLSITNPIEKRVDVEKLGTYTTKEDKDYHGLGIENVRRTVKIYNGMVEFVVDSSSFIARVQMWSL